MAIPNTVSETGKGFIKSWANKANSMQLSFCVGPLFLWVLLFVIAPLAIILYFSFMETDNGRILQTFTVANYLTVLQAEYYVVFVRSFLYTIWATAVCITVGYLVAYWIAMYGGKWKVHLLFLIIIPEFTAYLIRLYALRILIGRTGIINEFLMGTGLISAPLEMLYTPYAVMLGLVYTWLPFAILPLYASISGLDPNLLKAASDLGATPAKRFFRVTLPLTKGGLFAAIILVAIPSLGEWLVPFVLGGDQVMMIGSLVEFLFTRVGNIPLGSSIAILLTAVILILIYLLIKIGGEDVLERML